MSGVVRILIVIAGAVVFFLASPYLFDWAKAGYEASVNVVSEATGGGVGSSGDNPFDRYDVEDGVQNIEKWVEAGNCGCGEEPEIVERPKRPKAPLTHGDPAWNEYIAALDEFDKSQKRVEAWAECCAREFCREFGRRNRAVCAWVDW